MIESKAQQARLLVHHDQVSYDNNPDLDIDIDIDLGDDGLSDIQGSSWRSNSRK
jgi:hypothetical protein